MGDEYSNKQICQPTKNALPTPVSGHHHSLDASETSPIAPWDGAAHLACMAKPRKLSRGMAASSPACLLTAAASAPSACGLPLAATRCATCGSSSTVASLRAPASTGAAAPAARTAKRPASSSLTISLLIRIGRPPRLPSQRPTLRRAQRKQHSLTSGCVPSHQLGEVVTKLVSHGEVAPGHTPIEHTKLAHSAVPFRSGAHEEYSEVSACP